MVSTVVCGTAREGSNPSSHPEFYNSFWCGIIYLVARKSKN